MIGVLGGTFDPIHFGHINPALELLRTLPLREIRFVLARNPPHREPPLADAAHRWRMLELALQAHPRLLPDDNELRRDGPSYTIDTVRALREEVGDVQSLCLILGADAFADFTAWRSWREVLEQVHIVITARPGSSLPTDGVVGRLLQARRVPAPDDLSRRPGGSILACSLHLMDISSTAIRKALAGGDDAGAMLPATVLRYIREYGLYQVTPRDL
ncbi:MAG: nicotinate-nucleotide adenylyltransferase [Gammaproteobacteria bacterium]|nr:nicotinate-nucleotide adenylyltransferase [Gammaproteobacteria bacterium]